ncbi:MAG: cupredoxin family copper-binding protein [Bdellovibrionota bacterium]
MSLRLSLVLAFTFAVTTSVAANKKAAGQHHTITIENVAFTPAELTIQKGDTVEWVNKDIIPHTVTTEKKGFDSGNMGTGATWKYEAKKSGSFDYRCNFHPNMKAKLIVK